MRKLLLLSLFSISVAAQASDSLKIGGLTFGGGTNTAIVNGTALYAGPFDASLNGGATQRVFCVDLHHWVNYDPTGVLVQDTASLGLNFGYAAKLYNRFAGGVGNDPLENAALQVALWSAVEGGVAYSDFWNAGVSSRATQMLGTDVSAYSSHATYFNAGGANQSMLGGTPQAVPEPASMLALGAGAVGLLRRRKR